MDNLARDVPPPDGEAAPCDPALVDAAVRLADEGIPIRAIARSLKIPSSEVYEVLNFAIQEGKILELPRDDWPAGSARSQRALYQGTILENSEQLRWLCIHFFKVTKQQSAALSTLLRRSEMTKAQLHTLLQENRPMPGRDATDAKIVDVVIFHTRKKLKPHGVFIDTLWGSGYCISPESKARALALLEAFNLSSAAAIALPRAGTT